ncbi:hypothetical protein DFW101_0644 [Solidesulfovibrio carbinoliphilus subsp. oakridgensis]|uniref:Uncharacterized protein n=1 Tax=Solidesulfovibrio carbinoliphilus subsp. oakridgensis TaxID=694327 RepID=G7QE05_9BACT|nr:hypothetical protein [Solidesulfovibrio carbinoliphilus]EHJ46661.1 hypothetical protein DFW101_0644 [Solidesulfovibrio carbinoliphilus subsp. oakridgensis]
MATKSRLGREPSSGGAAPVGKKPSPSAPSHNATKKKAASESPAANADGRIVRPAAEAVLPPPQSAWQAATPAASEQPAASEISAVQPVPQSVPISEGQAAPAVFASESFTPIATEDLAQTPASAVQPVPQSVPIPEGQAAPAVFASESFTPVATEDLGILPAFGRSPAEVTVHETADAVSGSSGAPVPPATAGPDAEAVPATAPSPQEGAAGPPETPPAEVFLRGVLENIAPEGGLRYAVAVDPGTETLPVEKLFYFSHALQLLLAPLEWPASSRRHPLAAVEPPAGLTIRLARIAPDRHSLRVYDNGYFFSQYLSDTHLEMEALRPLVLFVAKRHGSIAVKRGRTVEFEIIG